MRRCSCALVDMGERVGVGLEVSSGSPSARGAGVRAEVDPEVWGSRSYAARRSRACPTISRGVVGVVLRRGLATAWNGVGGSGSGLCWLGRNRSEAR